MQADQPTALEALSVAVAARVPVLLWGGPGTGKSSAVHDLAVSMNWSCEIVIASIREPSDFAGRPVVADGAVRFAPPLWARRLASAGHGILFLDEISTAPPVLQAALLRVVLERVVGDLDLPPGVAVVAAANPPEQASDGWDLTAPLANRFCHIDWNPDAGAFAQGITAGWPRARVPQLAEGWAQRQSFTRGLIGAFVAARPSLLSVPPRDPSVAGRAWPSPRTWEMAACLLAAAEEVGSSEMTRMVLVAGAVGDGAGIELLNWMAEMDLGDPEAALRDPASFVLPERGDRAYAALSAVAAAVAGNATPERWVAGWKVLARAGEDAADVAATAARVLARCRPDGVAPPAEVKVFAPLLKDAGLL
jgi:AAA domain (dynein-related subfamily)